MIRLSDNWVNFLTKQPETGMGYHIVSLRLKDGRHFNQVIVDSGSIVRIKGLKEIPFIHGDIVEIIVTHDKWDFSKER